MHILILKCKYFYFLLYANCVQLDMTQSDWLRKSRWDPEKKNIILIHGYAGGDDTLPIAVLKDGACSANF